MKYGIYLTTPIGQIGIVEENDKIIKMAMGKQINLVDWKEKETPLLNEAKIQLQEYFSRKRKQFTLPVNPQGTPFMKKVWEELEKIPYGETRNYQQIAQSIGNPKACRAIGMANHRNPIPIIIPCHRVIGKNKELVGYALGLPMKQYLLDLENK